MKARPQLWRSLVLFAVASILLALPVVSGKQVDAKKVVEEGVSAGVENPIEQKASSLRDVLEESSSTTKTAGTHTSRGSRHRALMNNLEDDPFIHKRRMKKSKKSNSQRAPSSPTTPAPVATVLPTTPAPVAPTSALSSKKSKSAKAAKSPGSKGGNAPSTKKSYITVR